MLKSLTQAALLVLCSLQAAKCMAAATAAPSSITWAKVTVGNVGAPKSATLTNGSPAISISSIAIKGTNAGDFAISSKTCGASLAASATCTATILFKPVAAGLRSASLTFTDTASNSPQTVALSGTGAGSTGGGSVTASPSSLPYGSVAVGSSGSLLSATLSNGTAASITLGTISVTGSNAADFTISSKTCGSSLAASASCSVTLGFRPGATGARTATLGFTDSASNSPQTVALSGTGTTTGSGSITVSPSRLIWDSSNAGATQTVTIHNSGSTTTSISSIALTSTDPQDFAITGGSCGTSLTAGASCTAMLAFTPTAAGTRVALLTITDSAVNSPQSVAVSGTAGPSAARTASITVDFASRSGSGFAIAPGMMGAQYLESLPDTGSRNMVVAAGFKSARLHGDVTQVYATPTPVWNSLDGSIRSLQALGVHPILEIDGTPPWLQPSPLVCTSSPSTNIPKDLNAWGKMAASYVAHYDKLFPGVVLDYEIWNEPNTGTLCSTDRLSAYLNIYAAAAPQMKAQAKADGATIRVGGPASAGVQWPSLLTDPRTAPYVDFYSYHIYLGTPTQIQQGMTWDGAGGTPSLLAMTLNGSSGEQARYLQAVNIVKAGKTPLGANTPIYYDEYNDDWAFLQDCCRNSPIYSPLFNGLTVARILNSVYVGANQVPTKMVYFAATDRPPFCLVGVANAAMDCTRAASSSSATPYPQLYTYQLISATGYLDLVDGGHMAKSVTLSSAASSQGLVATGYYTGTTDSVLIINPTASAFSGVTLQLSNTGFSSPQTTLYTLNSTNTKISSWPSSPVPVTSGSQVTFDVPAHSVLAVSMK